MPPVDLTLFNVTLVGIALAVAVLASMFLGLEVLANENVARRAPGICAVALAVVGLAALWRHESTYLAAGFATLATLLFVTWPSGFGAAQPSAACWLPRKAVWGVVLGLSVVSARLLSSQLAPAKATFAQATFNVQDIVVSQLEAVTDQGTKLPLFHSRFCGPAVDVSLYALQLEAEQGQVIRVSDANPICNCHGWLFAEGQFALRDVDVAPILRDNGYAEVEQVLEGDLAIYFDGDQVVHSGLVRLVDASGLIIVESKWGPFGVYLHPADRQPFSGACRYFRSDRPHHRLAVHPVSSTVTDADGPIADRSCPLAQSLSHGPP